jgi:tetratricopeptide (TPR) repeat protein
MKTSNAMIVRVLLLLTLMVSPIAFADTQSNAESADIQKAMQLYSEALSLETNSSKRTELLDQAEAILQKVIDNNPESLDAHRKLMGVYLLKRDYARGIQTLQDAINLSPQDPKLFVALAILYEHAGAYEYANAVIDQALVLDPDMALAKQYKISLQNKIDMMEMDSQQAVSKDRAQ